MSTSDELNTRVWRVFKAAGFETRPDEEHGEHGVDLGVEQPRPIDLLAWDSDLNVRITGENKSGKHMDSFTRLVADHRCIMEAEGAQAGLFVITGKKIDQDHLDYATERCISVWTEEQLAYYEALTGTIGKWARYEMIRALNVETEEQTDLRNVLAIRLRQPTPESNRSLFMFTLSPETLLKTCVIYRRAVEQHKEAYQRVLKTERLRSVARFVSGKNALMPPNLIVALHDSVRWDPVPVPTKNIDGRTITLSHSAGYDMGVLTIPLRYASLELIDGQHRLYGFVRTSEDIRQNFNLVVLGIAANDLQELAAEEKRETFVRINDNSRRADPNLIAHLKYTEDPAIYEADPERMAIYLTVKLSEWGPFKDRVRITDWAASRTANMTLKGISGYDMQSLVGPRGELRKKFPENKAADYRTVLRTYFGLIYSTFSEEWADPSTYIVGTNRGVSAFLKLLKSILKNLEEFDSQCAEGQFRPYLAALAANFGTWETSELRSGYVGSGGWNRLHRDMVSAIQGDLPEFTA